ncbi:hypothetical protein [Variovorax rhizosphaerae]|uniref:Chemotaxis methyl-accepting receptor HlyB-like 4HB MCP domain-containing protein n=1 Tax=Variovorax rhizosphaerae TaxID=1836200 RepID=A0ABU8WSW6_9BURK
MIKSFSTLNQVAGLILGALALWASIVAFVVPYCDSKLSINIDVRNQLARSEQASKLLVAQIGDARIAKSAVQSLIGLNLDYLRDVRNEKKAEEIIQNANRALVLAERSQLNINVAGFEQKWYAILVSSGFEPEGPVWYWPTKELIAPGDALVLLKGSIGGPPTMQAYANDLGRMLDKARNQGRHQKLYAGLREIFGSSPPLPPGETTSDILARRLETIEIEIRRLDHSLQDLQESTVVAKEKAAANNVPLYCKMFT